MTLPDEAATAAFAHRLAPHVKEGDVIFLIGPLGAGKTAFARALIRALSGAGNAEIEVPSPTFTLVQTYEGLAVAIWHFDLFRIERPEEIWELGMEQAWEEGVSLIEWPERAQDLMPEDRLEIRLDMDGAGRRATLTGSDDWQGRIGDGV